MKKTAKMLPSLRAAFDKTAETKKEAMLQLNPIGPNMTEVETDEVIVLFSYSTPVAYEDKASGQCYRTSERFSTTTSRHINKWLEGREAQEVDQSQLEGLVQVASVIDEMYVMGYGRKAQIRTPGDLQPDMRKDTALAEYLGEPLEDIEPVSYSEDIFEIGSQEWLVLTDEEADQAVFERIEEDLWAFNPSFLAAHTELEEDNIKAIQEKMYERASPVFRRLIADFERFVGGAIMSDGRGHFLSPYDGNEVEETVNGEYFYLYRLN